jgi:arsenate reductase (thioredoxin)
MAKIKVLFVCVHNSARSQMAEAFLNNLAGEKFSAESAGLEPGTLNPFVVEAMREIGTDISDNKTKSVFDFFKQGRLFDFVIAVCDAANGERCPIFPSVTKRLNWSFEDPASFAGTHDEKLAKTRLVRNKIKSQVENFIKELSS